MGDSGVMEAVTEGVVALSGDLNPYGEEQGPSILSEDGERDLSRFRRSERKKSLRSISGRGRLAKSRPKSPMIRMVEMRRGGLRGRALRVSESKGSEGSELKSKKKWKGFVDRGLQVLATIPESPDVMPGSMEGLKVLEPADDVFDDLPLGISVAEGALVAVEAGCGDPLPALMEEMDMGQGVGEATGGEGANKGVVNLPLGAYFEGGRLLVVEDEPDDNERRVEHVEAPLLLTNESELLVAEMDNGNVGVNWAEVGEINLHNKSMGDTLPTEISESGIIISEMDIALDLYEAQPLQNMEFVKSTHIVKSPDTRVLPPLDNMVEGLGDEDFPPLSREGLKKRKEQG